MVLNPEVFNVLPVKHNYTPDKQFAYTAMFIPAYRMVSSLVDDRGWCDPEKAKQWYELERLKKVADPKGLLIYKAEYCFTIEEALIQQGDNMFPREQLAEQQAQLTVYKNIELPQRGYLSWRYDEQGVKIGVKWQPHPEGTVYITEHPIIAESGSSYNNLYVGGIDSIDIGGYDSAAAKGSFAETQLSGFAILIKKRAFGLSDPKYVAAYKDRPEDIRQAYDIAAMLLTYYGAKAVIEASRTALLTFYRDKKYMHLLMKRPRSTMPDISKGNSNMYGTPATVKVINHYRELIYDFVLDYWHTINFIDVIDQLLNYTDARKKYFDWVASMGMCELADEELSLRKPVEREAINNTFQDIGWFKDAKGYRHYGIIPKTEEELYATNRISTADSWLYEEFD